MAKKIVTLYIDDTSLRLMEAKGKRIKKLAESSLQFSSAEIPDDIKEEEIVSKIKSLLKRSGIKTRKVILGLSGRHCLSRPIVLPELPKAMLAEAVIREAKRVLPISIDQLYISWQATPTTDGKTQVFLVAIPCRTADTLQRILRQAGLKPYLMDIKPLALARVVKETTAVVVDVQPTEYDLVVLAHGVPQPIRTVPFPSETLSRQEKLALVSNDLKQTVEFFNTNNPEEPLDSGVPVFVSGELAKDLESTESLSDELGYTVLPLSSPLKHPKDLDLAPYMTNIGLTLKELKKEAGPLTVNLNILPEPYRSKPISLSKIIAVPTAAAVISLIVGGVMVIQVTAANIEEMNSQLASVNHIIEQKQSTKQELKQRIGELEQKITVTKASLDDFTAAMKIIDDNGNVINGDLQAATGSLPNGVNLAKISNSKDQLALNGSAPSEAEILAYARNLDDSGRFPQVTISSIRRMTIIAEEGGESIGEEMEFSLLLTTRGEN
ncbi:pilus assembly protein PilM [Chloroflexota bacterium]